MRARDRHRRHAGNVPENHNKLSRDVTSPRKFGSKPATPSNRRVEKGMETMTAASANASERADRKIRIMELAEEKVNGMDQGTVDFFSREDRRELNRQGFQNEEILKDLETIKSTAEKLANKQAEAMAGHENRIRTLELALLQFKTQITTSWWWILLLSGIGSAVVNVTLKLLLK